MNTGSKKMKVIKYTLCQIKVTNQKQTKDGWKVSQIGLHRILGMGPSLC